MRFAAKDRRNVLFQGLWDGLGGAGGLESVFTVLSVFNDVVPPTINLEFPDEECNLDYCANDARDKKINFALKNNFGFGGTNGSLIFKKIGVNL